MCLQSCVFIRQVTLLYSCAFVLLETHSSSTQVHNFTSHFIVFNEASTISCSSPSPPPSSSPPSFSLSAPPLFIQKSSCPGNPTHGPFIQTGLLSPPTPVSKVFLSLFFLIVLILSWLYPPPPFYLIRLCLPPLSLFLVLVVSRL